MSLWTAAEAAAATGGTATGDWAATGVSIDTRSLEPGDLFIALKDARDGHDFVADALARGAAAAMVSRRPDGVAEDAPLLLVDDVQAALDALGHAGRARSAARVVAVTGSVGKTSTKEMLRTVLTRLGPVHAAEKSFNNHWGVPLTLARMPRDTAVAVIEIGMSNPGEIAPLSRMARPHVALITAIAPAHLAAFDSIEGIAHEKASIFEGLEPGGTAIYPADLPTTPILAAAAPGPRMTFAANGPADVRATEIRLDRAGTTLRAHVHDTDVLVRLATLGRHFARNALGVLAVADCLGADPALAALDIGAWAPPAGRGQVEGLLLDPIDDTSRVDLIDDAYNANPSSMAAALEVLAAAAPTDGVGRVGRGRRIAVLGDMLELGPEEEAMHIAIAQDPSLASVDRVHCVGPRMRALYRALPLSKRGEWVDSADTLAERIHGLIDAGDVILVKGSNGARVWRIVDAIRKLGHPLADQNEGER